MYQIDNASAATTQPPSSAPGTAGYFTDGNPASNVPATIVPAEWLNSVMMELCNAVTTAGITPDETKFNQLSAAITATVHAWIDPTTVLKVANNLSDVQSAATACTNIGALQKANNLSDVASKPTACTNIGAVQKAGDTMTGALTVNYGAGLVLTTAAGNYRGLFYQTGASNRWAIGANQNAESGSNAGSDFSFDRYSDAGAWVGTPMSITCSTRSTGTINIAGAVSLNSTGTLSPPFYLNANGYLVYQRANSSTGAWEIVNSANTAVNMSLSDGGLLALPRAGLYVGNVDGLSGLASIGNYINQNKVYLYGYGRTMVSAS